MTNATYDAKRSELETYFDSTAVDAWKRLTSDAPVGRVRATVRAGRKEMRETLVSWLPANLSGARVLDAGCGTGALAVEVARRGADVLAIDISPTLVGLAKERLAREYGKGRVSFEVGDMLDPALGQFDYVVAMDSLIHYEGSDIARTLAALASRTRSAMLFTVAPRTPALTVMHALGKLFPRGDRSPAIAPISRPRLEKALVKHGLADWALRRAHRVSSGFYISEALEARPK